MSSPNDVLNSSQDDNDNDDDDHENNNDNDSRKRSGVTSTSLAHHRQPSSSDSGPASAPSSSMPRLGPPVFLSDRPPDAPPSPTTINSTCSNASSLMPSLLTPLLCCSVCTLPFNAPTTLHCGHTICSDHVADNCPVPSCSPEDTITHPNIPASSTVAFFPFESSAPSLLHTSTPRLDVTINNIVSLVSSIDAELDFHPTEDSDSSSADVDEDSIPPPPASSSRIRPRRNSSPSPPRIRKRRRYSPVHDEDLLSHLRKQSAVQKSTPRDEPLLPSHSPSIRARVLARFEKELLTELTCNICCTLMYQPVTTPCQHVCSYILCYPLFLIYHIDVLFQMSTPRPRPQYIMSYLQTRASWLFLFSGPSRK
jgi:hypothetical protein